MTINRREIFRFGVCLILATGAKYIGLGEDDTSIITKTSTDHAVEAAYPVWSQAKFDIFDPYPSLMDMPASINYSHNGPIQP